MDARRKVLLFDSLLGTVWIGSAFSFTGPTAIARLWWIVAISACVAAGAIAAEEHGYAPTDSLAWVATAVVGVVAVGALAVVTATVFLAITTEAAISALLVGLGVGVLGYRIVYGVVRPIPEGRLERARKRAV